MSRAGSTATAFRSYRRTPARTPVCGMCLQFVTSPACVCRRCRLVLQAFRVAGAEPPGRLDEREHWLPAAGFDGYRVSTFGRVESLDRVITTRTGARRAVRGRILTTSGGAAYPTVSIRGRTVTVHTILAQTFLGPRPPGALVLHGNDDPRDLWLGNLSYGDRSTNARDALRHGCRRRCDAGHELTKTNMFVRADGTRVCLICLRGRTRDAHHLGEPRVMKGVESGDNSA